MSTPDRAGWYEDPDDETQLRYFDGIVWSEHRVPRNVGSPAPTQPQYEPAAEGSGGAPFAPGTTAPQHDPGTDVYGRPHAGGQPGGQAPPPHPTQQYPAQAGWGPPSPAGPTTGDGWPLAGYGQRAGAFLIDVVIIGTINVITSGWAWWLFMADYWNFAWDAAMNDPGAVQDLTIQQVMGFLDYTYFFIALAIVIVVQAIYGIGFLVARSATPGKMVMGISVRRTDRPGRLGFGTAFMRMLLPLGLRVLWTFTGLIEIILRTVDLLWPLKDDRRQALHDKIAGTQVVNGKQPRNPDS